MKKLALMTLVFITSFAQAQEKMQSKQKMQDYTPEEMAQVQTKQLTLDLDLTEAQQKQVETLFLENAKTRKAKMEQRNLSGAEKSSKASLSKEEKLTMKNESLDQQIEMKAEMKAEFVPRPIPSLEDRLSFDFFRMVADAKAEQEGDKRLVVSNPPNPKG